MVTGIVERLRRRGIKAGTIRRLTRRRRFFSGRARPITATDISGLNPLKFGASALGLGFAKTSLAKGFRFAGTPLRISKKLVFGALGTKAAVLGTAFAFGAGINPFNPFTLPKEARRAFAGGQRAVGPQPVVPGINFTPAPVDTFSIGGIPEPQTFGGQSTPGGPILTSPFGTFQTPLTEAPSGQPPPDIIIQEGQQLPGPLSQSTTTIFGAGGGGGFGVGIPLALLALLLGFGLGRRKSKKKKKKKKKKK